MYNGWLAYVNLHQLKVPFYPAARIQLQDSLSSSTSLPMDQLKLTAMFESLHPQKQIAGLYERYDTALKLVNVDLFS